MPTGPERPIRDPAPTPIRLCVVAETRLYREGLVEILGRVDGMTVLDCAAPRDGVVAALRAAAPDVLLVGASVSEVKSLVSALDAAGQPIRVVALDIHAVDEDVMAWAGTGAAGFVSRESTLDELITVVRGVAAGDHACSSAIADALLRAAAARHTGTEAPLWTDREREIVALVDAGLSNKEIARRLDISLSTVKNHLHNVYEKSHLRGRVAVVARHRI